MINEIIKGQTPEEQELHRKLFELADLEEELAQRELDLATLKAELNAFEISYLRIVGVRIAELDEIKDMIEPLIIKSGKPASLSPFRASSSDIFT